LMVDEMVGGIQPSMKVVCFPGVRVDGVCVEEKVEG
jgi:hypothetical protein